MTKFQSLAKFLNDAAATRITSPLAMIFAEDEVEIDTCLRHHIERGFETVILFADDSFELPEELEGKVIRIQYDMRQPDALPTAVNTMIDRLPGVWMYYCFNGEYLFYPFCETRTVGELLTFHTEERRNAMLTYVVDLYAGDLDAFPNAVSLNDAYLDKSGYYTLARPDPNDRNRPKDRQLDFFGGLRWRYEEHIPFARRKIDRVALFRSKPGLRLKANHTFNDEEYNTYTCPWHHNLTASIMSFRTAKALKHNPGSSFDVQSFRWRNSVQFEWHSQQLLDLGLMEPGQWF